MSKKVTRSSTQTLSVQHVGSTQGPHLFSTQNLSVEHQKLLSSTPKSLSSTPKPLSSTPKTPHFNTVFVWGVCWTEGVSVLIWVVFGVDLRRFWCETEGCWTERFFVWNWGTLVPNWGVFGGELTDFGCWKGVVLVWNRCIELRRSVWNWGVLL